MEQKTQYYFSSELVDEVYFFENSERTANIREAHGAQLKGFRRVGSLCVANGRIHKCPDPWEIWLRPSLSRRYDEIIALRKKMIENFPSSPGTIKGDFTSTLSVLKIVLP
ncbi:MAG: hypothetical protein ACOYM3_00065 [Terrimicrobiaceae bacterium]